MRTEAAEYFVKTARAAVDALNRGRIAAMRQRGIGLAAMEQQGMTGRLTNYPNLPTTRTIKVRGADTPKVPDLKKVAASQLAQKFQAVRSATTPVVKPKMAKTPKLKLHITSASAQKPNFAQLGIK
jgi:hypothetical protein